MKRRKVVDVYMIRQGVQLIVGLWLFGVRIALMLRAGLGLDPWDVLHQGISVRTNVSIGVVVLVVSVLVTGLIANAAGIGLYIGAALGPGARDGLMTGLAARGVSVRLARTAIEISVLGVGWLLGGAVGVGTIIYAVAIGPLAHLFIPLFATTDHPEKHHEANVARSHH